MLRLNNKFTPLKFTQNLPTKKVDEEEPEKNNSNNESVSNTTNNTPSKNVDVLGNYKNLQEYLNTVPVKITFVTPEERSTVDSSEDADGVQAPETPTLNGAAAGNFDFSIIDGYDDEFVSFYQQPSISRLGEATSKNVIDEGYWDNALEALEKLKPQLHEYIKAQMENTGANYDYDSVEKILNTFISEAVTSGLINANLPLEQDENNWDKCNVPTGNSTSNFKMSAVVNSLLSKIDGELGIDSKYTDFGMKSYPHDAPNAFTEENQTRGLYNSPIMETADKYLSEEEKILKSVLVGLTIDDSIPYGNTYTWTKQTVDKVVELYSEHVKSYLKSQYQTLSDEEISTILNNVKNDTLQNSVIESIKNSNGSYDLEAIVKYFGEKADNLANNSHNEGALFGITDATEAKEARTEAEELLKDFQGMSDYKLEQILTTVSSYGDKLNSDDLFTITAKLWNLFENNYNLTNAANSIEKDSGLSLLQKELIKIIDEYLSKKEAWTATSENGSSDDTEQSEQLKSDADRLREGYLNALDNSITPTKEEVDAIKDMINKNIDNTRNIFEF